LTSITLDDILHKKAKRVMLFTDEIIKGAKMQVHVSERKWGQDLLDVLKKFFLQ